MKEDKPEPQNTKAKVKVTNENNGKHETFDENDTTLVSTVIDKMYASSSLGIGRAKLPGDRLRCNAGGADIFQFSHLTLEKVREDHCKSANWLFAGEAGGAEC